MSKLASGILACEQAPPGVGRGSGEGRACSQAMGAFYWNIFRVSKIGMSRIVRIFLLIKEVLTFTLTAGKFFGAWQFSFNIQWILQLEDTCRSVPLIEVCNTNIHERFVEIKVNLRYPERRCLKVEASHGVRDMLKKNAP